MILPVPRQFGQAPCVWNMPSGVRWVCVTTPVPRQFGQVSAVVPFCGTCAAAVITGFDALDRDLFLTAECGFLEGQDHGLTDGFASLRCVAAGRPSAAKAAAEEQTEQVARSPMSKPPPKPPAPAPPP